MIKAEIICDSINAANKNRLTTWVLEYPRFVHAEFMTHRMFSKNAASSRAIPFEKFVEQITNNPAMPEWWGKNQSGMQANEELSDEIEEVVHDGGFGYDWTEYVSKKAKAKELWLNARDQAIQSATKLYNLGLHKQIVNRILEPWFHIRVIMSATDYGNFFALRAHKDAQPEIRVLAEKMLEEYNKSEPKQLSVGQWHIPFGDKIDRNRLFEIWNNQKEHQSLGLDHLEKKISIARCARISYLNFEGKDDYEADIKLCDKLFSGVPKHLSPTEHVAQAIEEDNYIGNFRGFKQFRKYVKDENLEDDRIIKK